MIVKLKYARLNRIISPWSAFRNARSIQRVKSHKRSWAALRLVWRKKRKGFDRAIVNSSHTREVFRTELKQFHRFTSSTNHRVEIRQELATVPKHQQSSSRYVHLKSTNKQILCGNGNPITAKTREKLKTKSTLEPCRQSSSLQNQVTKSEFLTRVELKYCIQKQARDAANFSPAQGLHQDRTYRSFEILRGDNTSAPKTRLKPYSQDFGDVIARPTASQFELPRRFSNRTSRSRLVLANSSSLPVSAVAVMNRPTEAIGARRLGLTNPVEIVWRTEQRKNLTPQQQVSSSHNSSTFNAQTVSVEPSTKTSAEWTTPPNARSTMTKPMLDPAIVDRLTEDIIRRVERKMRIERERRGIGG